MTTAVVAPPDRAAMPRPGLVRWFDAALGRVSMYVLVLVVLGVVATTAVVLAAAGILSVDPFAMVASAAVALTATWAGTAAGARLTGARPHPGSWAITGLILFLLLWPDLTATGLGTVAVAGLAAGLSKFVLAWRGRHVLNPAAAGVVVAGLAGLVLPGLGTALWWVGSAALLPVVALGAVLVLWRTRRLGYAIVYAVPAWALTTAGYLMQGVPVADAAWWALSASPIVFLAGFMLSEPLTTPARRGQRAAVAALVAVGSTLPLFVPVSLTPELALLAGNAVAFLLGQRGAVVLRLRSAERRGTLLDLRFEAARPLRARAGQYLEVDVPSAARDAKGRRRALSIASDPVSGTVRLITRVGERPSAFKSALAGLAPGDEIRATGVGGDFFLPGDTAPDGTTRDGTARGRAAGGDTAPRRGRDLALVASGVGVTPFLAHLAAPIDGRDAVLVHAVRDAAELPLPAEIPGASSVIAVVPSGSPGCGPDGPVLRDGSRPPAGWVWCDGTLETDDLLSGVILGLADREIMVSGSPGAVATVRHHARAAGVPRVRTDTFLGY
ncbi:hypothetical protein GCM10027059_13570 [Myceligenerans halotolerans]